MKIGFAITTKIAAIIVVAVSVALPLPSIAQATSLVVSPATATAVGLASAAQYQVLSDAQWSDYEKVLVIATLNGVMKMAANNGQPMASSAYSSLASMVQAQLDASAPSSAQFQSMDIAGRLRYGIDSLTPLASGQQSVSWLPKVLFELEKIKFLQLETVVDPTRQTPADLALYSVRSYALQFIADQVQQASNLAQNDPQYAAAVNVVLQSLTTFDTTSSYAQIQSSYAGSLPSLPAPNSDGSYTLNEQDLVSQYQSVIGAIQAMVDSDLNTLESNGGAAARKHSIRTKVSAHSRNARTSRDSPAAAGPSDSCTVAACTTAQSVVTGLSKLVGFLDPQLGSQISAVGTAGIQAGYAIDEIVNAGGLALNPVTAIIGAGASIFSSIFGGSSSSANAAVLQQIQKLSQQIARLQQDMDAQFAKVDATLNTILTTLDQNFALVNWQLGTLNGSATQIKNALLDIETQLNSMETYTLAYQQAEEADTLMLSVNGCLNYFATHNGQDIGNSTFDNCQNTFFTSAQTNALDAIWAPQLSDFAVTSLYNFFVDFSNSGVCPSGCPTPFAATVNALAQLPIQSFGLSPLSTLTLANPDEWTLGTRTYLLMAFQWPQYQSGLNVSYLNQLIQIGTNLQQGAANISTTQSGGQVTQNPALFSAVGAKYTATITSIQSAANADVNAYESNPGNGFTRNGITPSLWAGGVNQVAPWRPVIATVPFCSGGAPLAPGPLLDGSSPAALPTPLPGAPVGLLTLVPDLYAFSQGYLSSGQLSMCITQAQWLNVYDDPYYYDGVCEGLVLSEWRQYYIPYDEYGVPDCQLGNLNVTLNVAFNGVPILTASVGTEEWSRFGESDGPGTYVAYAPPAAAQSGLLLAQS